MKIIKKNVKASEDIAVEHIEVNTVPVEAEPVVSECPYQCAIDHIYKSIECLGAVAKDDALARESIANLSVVLFDLKN